MMGEGSGVPSEGAGGGSAAVVGMGEEVRAGVGALPSTSGWKVGAILGAPLPGPGAGRPARPSLLPSLLAWKMGAASASCSLACLGAASCRRAASSCRSFLDRL